MSDGDKQFSAIFPACVENRDACPLAQRSPKATAQELEDQVWKLLDHVRTQPLVYGSQVIDYTSIEQSIVQASFDYYDNNQLTNLTASFALYLDLAENKTVPPPPPSEPSKKSQVMGQFPSSLAQYGIQCLDRNKRLLAGATLEEFLSASAELYGSSRTMAASDILLDMICTNWKIDPPERFNSDFNIKPNKPVLLMGNMADAHTSVRGAYNVSSTIEDSAVLEIDGYGVSALTPFPGKPKLSTDVVPFLSSFLVTAYFIVRSVVVQCQHRCGLLAAGKFAKERNALPEQQHAIRQRHLGGCSHEACQRAKEQKILAFGSLDNNTDNLIIHNDEKRRKNLINISSGCKFLFCLFIHTGYRSCCPCIVPEQRHVLRLRVSW